MNIFDFLFILKYLSRALIIHFYSFSSVHFMQNLKIYSSLDIPGSLLIESMSRGLKVQVTLRWNFQDRNRSQKL